MIFTGCGTQQFAVLLNNPHQAAAAFEDLAELRVHKLTVACSRSNSSYYTDDESTASHTNLSSLFDVVLLVVAVFTLERPRPVSDGRKMFRFFLSKTVRMFLLWSDPRILSVLLCLQVMICSWLQSTSWVMLWVWSTPTIPAPSWLLSTSIWTRTTSNCLWTTCRGYRRSTVRSQLMYISRLI